MIRLQLGVSASMGSILLFFLLISSVYAGIVHKPHDFACSLMVVFGDSLSDDGVEAEGESHGFARNSNGPVWPEYLNKLLSCQKYLNYAYSGAKSGEGNFYFTNWSGLAWQVEKFSADSHMLPPDALIIVQSGGITDYFTGENNTDIVIGNAHRTLLRLYQTLSSGTILLLNLIDPGSAPGMQSTEKSEEIQKRIAPLVSETNRMLTHMIYDPDLGLHKRGPKISVRLIDLNAIAFRAMSTMNTTDPFTHHNPDTTPRSVYTYAYHDLWHPSTFIHYKFAQHLLQELQDL